MFLLAAVTKRVLWNLLIPPSIQTSIKYSVAVAPSSFSACPSESVSSLCMSMSLFGSGPDSLEHDGESCLRYCILFVFLIHASWGFHDTCELCSSCRPTLHRQQTSCMDMFSATHIRAARLSTPVSDLHCRSTCITHVIRSCIFELYDTMAISGISSHNIGNS